MQRLWRAVGESRLELKNPRAERNALLDQIVGSTYPGDELKLPVPVNMLELQMTIMIAQLAASAPKVLVTSKPLNLKHVAANFEVRMNERIEEMDYSATHQLVVQDAMLLMGIVNVGLDYYETVEHMGRSFDMMESFAARIDFDDWVHDVSAKRMDQTAFCGHRYRMPFDAFMESKEFDESAKTNMKPDPGHHRHEGGEQRTEDMSHENMLAGKNQFRDYIEIYNLWIPHENIIVKVDSQTGKKLGVVDYDGPEGGPYAILTFHDVPNNIIPLSPLGLRKDLHDLVNNVWRKIEQSARDQKEILVYTAGAEKDTKRILGASHLQAVRVDHLEKMKQVTFNGPSSELQILAQQTMRIFDDHAGGLNALGGMGSLGDTATESQLISTAASQRVMYMRRRNNEFLRKVMQSMAWYEWTEPVRTQVLERQSRSGRSFTVRWSPETREGDFVQYDLQIDPHSMRDQSPEQLAQALIQYVTQVAVPLAQAFPQQGKAPDIGELTEIFARYRNMPELLRVMRDVGPQQEEEGRHDPQPRQAPVTTRNVVRTNRSGGGSRSAEQAAMMNLLGGANQGQKAQAVGVG